MVAIVLGNTVHIFANNIFENNKFVQYFVLFLVKEATTVIAYHLYQRS